MDIAYVISAILGGTGVVAMVVTVYLGIRNIDQQQQTILERLDGIERRLDERARG